MVETCKNAPLDEYLFNPAFVYESRYEHLLESIISPDTVTCWVSFLLCGFLLELDLENSTVGAITDFAPLGKICSD